MTLTYRLDLFDEDGSNPRGRWAQEGSSAPVERQLSREEVAKLVEGRDLCQVIFRLHLHLLEVKRKIGRHSGAVPEFGRTQQHLPELGRREAHTAGVLLFGREVALLLPPVKDKFAE
mgnify:CR=1 FL=1